MILPVRIVGRLFVTNHQQVYLSFIPLKDEKTTKTLDSYYDTYLNPGDTVGFVTVYKNFSEGGGANLFIIGGSDRSWVTSYSTLLEFQTNTIPNSKITEQLTLAKSFFKTGNLPNVKTSWIDKAEDFFGSDRGSFTAALQNARSQAVAAAEAASIRRKAEAEMKRKEEAAEEKRKQESRISDCVNKLSAATWKFEGAGETLLREYELYSVNVKPYYLTLRHYLDGQDYWEVENQLINNCSASTKFGTIKKWCSYNAN